MRIDVYDAMGRHVWALADGLRAAGTHDVPFDASALAPGVYLYRVVAGEHVGTGTLTRMR